MTHVIRNVFVGSLPWLIIATLLAAALLIKPQPIGQTVEPPAIEPRDRFYGVVSPASDVLWMAGQSGKIVISTDAGLHWIRQVSGSEKNLQSIASWDVKRAVVVGNDNVVLVTSDGGENWQKITVPRSDVANKLLRVETLSPGRAIAVGVMGAVLETQDYGQTWKRLVEEEDVAWNDLAQTGNSIWVVGEFGYMLRSRDQGRSWERVESPVEHSLIGIDFRDDKHGVIVGLDGLIMTTQDGGDSWQKQESGVAEHLYAVADTAYGWVAVGDKGRLLLADFQNDATWTALSLGEREVAWHFDVLSMTDGVYLVGANNGQWTPEAWRPYQH